MRGRVSLRLILAGAVALGSAAGAVAPAQAATRATRIAMTRAAKGLLHPHPLAVDERLGLVFVANPSHDAKNVSVLDASDGRLLRTIPVGLYPIAVAVDERSQRVFVAGSVSDVTQPGSLSVIDARSGRVVRTVAVGRNPVAVVVDAPANRAFVIDAGDEDSAATGDVTMLDATSGARLGAIDAAHPQAGAVDAQSGRVFIADAALALVCDAATGRLLQTILTQGAPRSVAVDERTRHAFVVTARGSVLMLDAASGTTVRTFTLGDTMSLSGVAVDPATGHVFVTGFDTASYAGQVLILDAATGARLGRVAVGPDPTSVAVAGDRVLVVHSRFGNGAVYGDGSVSILDARSGRVLHAVDVTDPWGMAVDGRRGLAYITDEDNAVHVLDLRSGAVMRTQPGL